MTHAKLLHRAAITALLAATIACSGRDSSKSAPGTAATPGGDTVVAKLNGSDIKASELETWIKEDLYKREVADKPESEVYDLRAQAIESLIDERLLADAAKKGGKSPDDYQADQVKALGPVTDDEVKAFFDENRSRLPPDATLEAFAARCADQQGKFWEYHDLLFANQQALADADLEKYAAEIHLDPAAFKTCRQDPATETRVNTDATAARAAGLTGTPAFFVNGILVSGARPLEDFTRWIDQEIAAKSAAPAAAGAPKS